MSVNKPKSGGFGKTLARAKTILAFLSTLVGQIVFYVLCVILIGFLVYIIVSVILKDIAKLVGVDAGTQSNNESYEYLNDLASSGYDSMLNAQELMEYHAFEYAVLMDCARFLEETGTTHFKVTDSAKVKIEELGENRNIWAFLAAKALCKTPDGESSEYIDSTWTALGLDGEPSTVGTTSGDVGNIDASDFENMYNGVFDTEHTKENLKYHPVNNEYTNETSLYPYLEIRRDYDIVTYYIEHRDKYNTALHEGVNFNLECDSLLARGEPQMGWLASSRFEYGTNPNYAGMSYAHNYILEHLFPLKICVELNQYNKYAYKNGASASELIGGGDLSDGNETTPSSNGGGTSSTGNATNTPSTGSAISTPSTGGGNSTSSTSSSTTTSSNGGQGLLTLGPNNRVDLYKEYGKSLYFTVQSSPTLHKIPLRILLDRFLPNAVLLSSWRILKDDESNEEDVVEKILEIYSEACLEGETSEGSKFLAKNVGTVNYAIDKNTKASQLFDKVVKVDTTLDKYLDGKDTNIIYDYYAPLFDSRIWAGESDKDSKDDKEKTDENTDNGEQKGNSEQEENESSNLAADAQQQFPGTFAEDVMDDIKLVLAHYSANHNVITKEIYDKLMSDIGNVVKIDGNHTSKSDFIIYTPLTTGNYLANCTLGMGEKDSHMQGDGKTHKNASNPYSASSAMQDCFVPFMKIAYTQKKGLRMTSVIINDRGVYTGYLVKGSEIEDYSKLSNKKTFAVFESRDMQLTTVRHWRLTTKGEKSDEKWFVEDAFEGLKLGIGDEYSVTINFKYPDGKKGQITIPMDGEFFNIPEEKVEEIILSMKVNGQSIEKGVNTLEPFDTAVIYENEDTTSRDYPEDYYVPPADPTLKPDQVPLYPFNTSLSGGESIVNLARYVNLKLTGGKEGEPVYVDTREVEDLSKYCEMDQSELRDIVIVYLYLKGAGREEFKLDLVDNYIIRATNWMRELYEGKIINEEDIMLANSSLESATQEFAVIYPTRMSIIPIKQDFWDSKIRFYLVKKANLWSGRKVFNNKLGVSGEFKNRRNFMYLVNSNPYCKGLDSYKCTKGVDWRCEMFAPIFGGDQKSGTGARETDILLILSEWLEASEQGSHAANHYIRDLNALIKYSKGIQDENGDYYEGLEPFKDSKDNNYIHPGSYSYLYIPDEILKFDDTTSEMAFWEDRIVCTPHDPIEQPKENYLRSKSETYMWQIVDYDLYEECQNGNGTASVYAFWMFGDTLSRTMYAIASNANDEQHEAVFSRWGDYAPGMHAAADLFGRNIVRKIYAEIYGSLDEPLAALIGSNYKPGSVDLANTESTQGGDFSLGYNESESAAVTEARVQKAERIIDKAIKKFDTELIEKIIDILYKVIPTKTTDVVDSDPLFSDTLDTGEILSMSSTEKENLKKEIIKAVVEGKTQEAKSKIMSIFYAGNISVANAIISEAGENYVPDKNDATVDLGDTTATAGNSLFDKKDKVTLKLGGRTYKFNGVAAATYGYELYRQTLILKDPEKAGEAIKEQLEKEIKWTPLRAVAPGIVTEVKGDARGGFTVRIQHAEGVRTSYLHMKRFPLVQVGQYVGASTLLGYEGTTGNSGTFHVHFAIHKKGGVPQEAAFPIRYMYPFFTPFFYEEKAEEAEYAWDSEYMSTTRTVFPYGQVSGVGQPREEYATEYEGGIVKIKNYVPTNPLVEDSKDLYDEDSGFEGFIDYSKLPVKNVFRNQKEATYGGQKLKTNPCYFNKNFIKAVISNNNKITGVNISWGDMTSHDNNFIIGVDDVDGSTSSSGDSASEENAGKGSTSEGKV